MELLGPRWLSECKALSFNLSECSIKSLFYKARAKILGKNSTQVKKYFRVLQSSEKASNQRQKPNSTVRKAGLDMSALHTACWRSTTLEAWARPWDSYFHLPAFAPTLFNVHQDNTFRNSSSIGAGTSHLYHSNHSSPLPQGLNYVGQHNLFKPSSLHFHIHPSDWQRFN